MKLLWLPLLLCLLSSTESQISGDVQDKLTGAADALGAVSSAAGADGYDIKRFATTCKKFGPALGALGPVTALIFSFLDSGEDETITFMKEEFKKIHDKLDGLENKIEALSDTVEYVGNSIFYQQTRERIKELERRYKEYLETPEALTKENFRLGCIDHDPSELLNVIHNRVAEPTVEPHLFTSIIDGVKFDNRKFSSWAKLVGSDSVLASQLRVMCLGVRNIGASDTLIKRNAQTASRQVSAIADALIRYQSHLQSGFKSQQLSVDLTEWLSKGGSNDALRNSIYKNLNDKFNWLYWTVDIYNGVSGFNSHTFSGTDSARRGVKSLFRVHGKNIVVYWSHKDDWSSHNKKKLAQLKKAYTDKCIKFPTAMRDARRALIKRYGPFVGLFKPLPGHITRVYGRCSDSGSFFKHAQKIHQCLSDCLKRSVPITIFGLHTVRFGNGLRSKGANNHFHNWCQRDHCTSVIIAM